MISIQWTKTSVTDWSGRIVVDGAHMLIIVLLLWCIILNLLHTTSGKCATVHIRSVTTQSQLLTLKK